LTLACLISLTGRETTAETLDWTWTIEEVNPGAGYGTSLALDADGWPHIATAGGGIRYEYKDAVGWHSEPVEGGDYGSAALVLGDDDTPHISYWSRSFATNGLKYAYKDTSGWHLEEVDSKFNSALSLGFSSSIALGLDGYPRIAYLYDNISASAITLKYAYKDATGWHPTTLYEFGIAGYGPTSLAIDPGGYAHIVTYRGTGYTDMVHVYQDVSGT
jgi:hypothetical protein